MNSTGVSIAMLRDEFKRLGKFLLKEMKPKGKVITPFNVVSFFIIALAAMLLVIRFTQGLSSITNLSQEFPWGLWIGFDIITGVAFAGGAYVLTFLVYILKLEKYHPIVRITVLNGFLAYVFYAGALLLDVGRPWNVINPIIGNSFGVSSIMFLVAWHFMLYMLAELIEFSPAIAEWIGWKKIHKILNGMTLAVVIVGITLSTLHQSALGALFLMAKSKLHPLWYSEFIPILFFLSSIFAGLSMVILEGSISQKVFRHRINAQIHMSHHSIMLGLSKICAVVIFVYLFLKILVFIHDKQWIYISSTWGYWYLLEIIGFVSIPLYLYVHAVRYQNIKVVKIASVLTLCGIVLNRLNTSVIAYNWQAIQKYFPSWMEIEVTLAIICLEIIVLRWIVNRMPVLSDPPAWTDGKAPDRVVKIFRVKQKDPEAWKVINS